MHRLEIEAGRWSRPHRTPLNERLCTNCNKIEDEYHFVLECILFTDLRKKYIEKYYWIRLSMFKFVKLINSENKERIQNLGVYIYNALNVRKSVLYAN